MRILLVEDEIDLCASLAFQLEKEGFEVDSCQDGEDGLYYALSNAYDLILLDRMLPHIEGAEIVRAIRKKELDTPVILLTALGTLEDKITGLDSGADDYIVKPFAFEELMARIRSITRRPRTMHFSNVLSMGDIEFKPDELTLHGPDGSCTLSKKEGALFALFCHNSSQTLTRDMLLSRVWGPDADIEDGNLDNYIHFLRRRLKTVKSCYTLKAIRGVGYRIEPAEKGLE